mmetsp:Transcript_4391/g.12596  ORF Transcript_4391/g.12596 Transcript_4391/m.12596 type:complete len:109 (+) Transcript_4391:1279-1605(+)
MLYVRVHLNIHGWVSLPLGFHANFMFVVIYCAGAYDRRFFFSFARLDFAVQFGDNLTEIVATNLKEQVKEQMGVALESINSYFEVNPELMLSVLGISMDDLDEKVVWV